MNFFKILRSARKPIYLVGFNLLLLSIFLEITSLVFYGIEEKKFFYFRDRVSADPSKTDREVRGIILNQKSTLDRMKFDESVITRLHPYFGFVYQPGIEHPGVQVNNMGFLSPFDFPFKKTNKNQFIVGITGGSVASNVAVNEFYTSTLRHKLQQVTSLKNKDIIIFNLALGGYKQPQQLLILDYFLAIGQEFDMVINIDGFNEVALSNINNHASVDISMPSLQHTAPLVNVANNRLSKDEIVTMGNIYQVKDQLKHELEQSDRCSFASCYTFQWFATKVLLNRYTKETQHLDRLMYHNPELTITKVTELEGDNSTIQIQKNAPLNDNKSLNSIGDLWVRSSMSMNQILSSRGIPYFHFIQPNQYYPTGRVFSSEERNIAIVVQNNPYVEGVQKGYPVLLEKSATLKQNNVNFVNSVNILDRETKQVYSDPCCHYTFLGNEIFTNFIADNIVQSINKNPTQKPPKN